MLPIKKRLQLHWQGMTVELDVAQDLFSSHQIDRGSRLLLASLAGLPMPATGHLLDFGCGYGVLALGWQAMHPGWHAAYVDRDALAVAFARHNAVLAGVGGDRTRFGHDVTPPAPPPGGFDLVLWNVPGKAGDAVLRTLTRHVVEGMATGGLLGLVVVNPLAATLRDAAVEAGGTVDLDETSRDHTVIHVRREEGAPRFEDAFAAGAFDRPAATFGSGDLHWNLTPVMGLPEYDALSHATELAVATMREASVPRRWLVFEGGVGHLAVVATRLWPGRAGVVASADALALRSSGRALEALGSNAMLRGGWGLPAMPTNDGPFDLIVVGVAEQITLDAASELIAGLERLLASGATVVLHGRSTEMGRCERQVKARPGWRTGPRTRLRGAAALVATGPQRLDGRASGA